MRAGGRERDETIECAWTIRYLDGPHQRDTMTALEQYFNAGRLIRDITPSREYSSNYRPASGRTVAPVHSRTAVAPSFNHRRNGSWIWPVQRLLRSSRQPGESTTTVLLSNRSHFRLTTIDRVIQCALIPELRRQRIQYSATWNKHKRTRKPTVCKPVN